METTSGIPTIRQARYGITVAMSGNRHQIRHVIAT